MNFVVTDIQPAPDNLAGATATSVGSAMRVMDAVWYNANRRRGFVPGNSI